jgi:hypothetical protein
MGDDKRKSFRYQTLARARIDGAPEGETLLKDISITGCCVECTVYPDIKTNAQYRIEVLPETAAEIGNFELITKSVWIRPGGYSCEIGFSILESPRGKSFQRYVDYLAWRTSMGSGSPAV